MNMPSASSPTSTGLQAAPLHAAPGSPLRIGIPCFASDGGRSGIGQYLIQVVRHLPAIAPGATFVIYAPQRDARLWDDLPPSVTVELVHDRYDSPIPSLWWHSAIMPGLLRAAGCNVVFLPAGNRRLGIRYGVPSVATVHDLSQMHVPAKYDAVRMFYATRVLPRLIGLQDHVIAVSSSTRDDVLAHTRITAEHTSVVPNGCDLERFLALSAPGAPPPVAPAGLRTPYVLYVARLEHPGKNHVTLLEAYALLRKRGLTHRLVFAGPRWPGSEAIDAAVERLGLSGHVTFAGFVDNADLPALYAAASLFVFPSLYEGFGIPLLEAMAAGTPSCVANVSSLPEVAGDAALLFNPRDPVEMSEVMERLLTDDLLRSRLRARGLARCREFTWERSAAGVLEACRRVSGCA
jgi:glycosyltransferase involved in cell wall biosynthesis